MVEQVGQPTILVRGIGDVGSAVAHRLFSAGYGVVIHDTPCPTTSRRTMAFTDAMFEGEATLERLTARHVSDMAQLPALLAARAVIPVCSSPLTPLLVASRPTILVDARMRKRAIPERQRGLAALTIGLGPNFVAGETTDLAVETAWGETLGAVLAAGPTRPLAGEPRPLAGQARNRFIYAPLAGIFRTARRIGDLIAIGEVVAFVDEQALRAPLTGSLRGLTHDNVPVEVGTKVVEVDPRGEPAQARIGERAGMIAAGVFNAVSVWRDAQCNEARI